MPLRKLGNTGIEVSPIALGGNVFGWTVDEATSFQLLDSWVASGFNFIDTADVYSNWVPGHSGGESETIIGRWLRGRGRRSGAGEGYELPMRMPGANTSSPPTATWRAAETSGWSR